MGTVTNFIVVAIGFCTIGIGVYVHKRRALFISLLSIGVLLCAYPFVGHQIATRDAYPWKIVVHREINYSDEPEVIFVSGIEWITDYERLKKQRGHVRSLLLNHDRTGKEWDVKGYIPISIAADVMYGNREFRVTRNLRGMKAGSYTFTLIFDENDVGSWVVEEQ